MQACGVTFSSAWAFPGYWHVNFLMSCCITEEQRTSINRILWFAVCECKIVHYLLLYNLVKMFVKIFG